VTLPGDDEKEKEIEKEMVTGEIPFLLYSFFIFHTLK
jgi:hypothetical protein